MCGFWLPNDPRGSWSDFAGAWELFRYGKATKVNDRRSYAYDPHDRKLRLEAKSALKHSPVVIDGRQALGIAKGFAKAAQKSGDVIYALAILPDHIHIILGRHSYPVEQVVRRLKQFAGLQLKDDRIHPFASFLGRRGALPSVFSGSLWKCFIDNEEYFSRAVEYVHENPLKEGKKRQHWSFVQKVSQIQW